MGGLGLHLASLRCRSDLSGWGELSGPYLIRQEDVMKKMFVVLGLVLLASSLLLASGQTKVNFVNATSMTLRFSVDGNPVCPGDIMPNGFCTEYISIGPHTFRAVDIRDSRNTIEQEHTIDDSDQWTFRVEEH
jgi:hypothetical protein